MFGLSLARWIDSAVAAVAPVWGAHRLAARASLNSIEKLLGNPTGPYAAAKSDRLRKSWSRTGLNENAVPSADLETLAARSWDLYRNNKHAKKIVRQIRTKVIGNGMRCQSLARDSRGGPDVAFRARAQQLWMDVANELDYRGHPGRGGQSFTGLSKTALGIAILSGHVLIQIRPISADEQRRRGLSLPLELHLIDPLRLDTSLSEAPETKHRIHRGIELDSAGIRVAYWILPYHPSDPIGQWDRNESVRVDAREIVHCYELDDADQLCGVPWMSAALDPLRDTGDYEYSELKSAAMASCIALAIKRDVGMGRIGLAAPQGESNEDDDGNRITRLQPGMIFETGLEGGIEGFNPQRPNTSAEAFIQHLLRTAGGSMPGIKGSTLTGDYRQSSFASERSADNEIWPEIEGVQQWFGETLCQPIYEAVLEAGVMAGYFEDVVSKKAFLARKRDLVRAEWHGPVCRSINPKDDALAASLRIANGQSTPQIEASRGGRNWIDNIHDLAEAVEQITALGLPDGLADRWIEQLLGLNPVPISAQPDDPSTPPKSDSPKKSKRGDIADGWEEDEEDAIEDLSDFPYSDSGPNGRHSDSGPNGRHCDSGPNGRHCDSGPNGRHCDSGPNGRSWK